LIKRTPAKLDKCSRLNSGNGFKMALVQKTKKVTHCLAATKQYMHRFFATLTHMYETGLQTDLVLVASDGTSFSIHKVTALI
jgi:hypothetical protein